MLFPSHYKDAVTATQILQHYRIRRNQQLDSLLRVKVPYFNLIEHFFTTHFAHAYFFRFFKSVNQYEVQ